MTQQWIDLTAAHIQHRFSGESSGHDWWHIYRVWQTALRIGKQENADLLVVQLAALLHDIADWKFNDGDDTAGPRAAEKWLTAIQVTPSVIASVVDIIERVSFKGASVPDMMPSLEGQIVQDADRLDAIGAIGIARAFAYGGSRERPLHDPGEVPANHHSFEEYKASRSSTISHFYEKLLLLKDRMHTETARQIAEERHQFMDGYLRQFFAEWDGKA